MATTEAVMSCILLLIVTASAFDPMPMQDFCVADFSNTALDNAINPFPCKDPATVSADDFYLQAGLNTPANTTNAYHGGLKTANVLNLPGLNTMGFVLARVDLEVNGAFPPHYHPRAAELIVVLEGCLEAGFVTSDRNKYTHFSKKLGSGDVFVIPVGLVHHVSNCGTGKSSAYATLNSQNPGLISVPQSSFGANPPINASYLASTYQMDADAVAILQGKNWNQNL